MSGRSRTRSALITAALAIALGVRPHAAAAQCANMPPGTQRLTFASMYMGGPWPFVIYLPPDYASSDRHYPVVYWFHGRGDNECTQVPLARNIQAAIQSGAAAPMIYVFMNGGASCNFDDTTCAGKAAESYIMKELIPYIDAHYRTVPGPGGRAIEGFSMGAEAVLRYFDKYSDQFCDAMAYAPIGGRPLSATAQANIRAKGKVVFRLTVGTADGAHLPGCRSYEAMLKSIALPHEYEEVPGVAHNPFGLWGAMNGAVGQRGLQLHTRCFGAAPNADGGAPPAMDGGPVPDDAATLPSDGDDVPMDSGEAPADTQAARDSALARDARDDDGEPPIVPAKPSAHHGGCAYSSSPTGPGALVVLAVLLARRRARLTPSRR